MRRESFGVSVECIRIDCFLFVLIMIDEGSSFDVVFELFSHFFVYISIDSILILLLPWSVFILGYSENRFSFWTKDEIFNKYFVY